MIERNRRTQLFQDEDYGPHDRSTRAAQLKGGAGRAASRRQLSTTLWAICMMTALLCGSWLATGCAQAKREPAAQEGQQTATPKPTTTTRPRRALEISNPTAPTGTDSREKTDSMNASEANGERSGTRGQAAFYSALARALNARGTAMERVCDGRDAVSRRVLEDYGAMFVASAEVLPPPVCMFTSEAEVTRFQQDARPTAEVIGGTRIELQAAAMKALREARAEAHARGLDITPRGGTEAARRSYDDTLRLWNSRFVPALAYWKGRGRLSEEQVSRLRKATLREQVRGVLELEEKGIFFSKDFTKSILYSVAAPGTSQHLSMLAFDVSQFGDARVRSILAAHGWFQTVKSDLPHFTYLGVRESDLPGLGLMRVETNGQVFWIPNIGDNR
ncbi:MAG TPA: hypothetical protein VF553_12270 [Pyrinomonadaceae bacterium]|jgi:hypothetical protein